MHALHQTLLPATAVHHCLYLANLTPSTIYPPPQPANNIGEYNQPEVKVIGNIVIAGGQDIRVFEIRAENVPIIEADLRVNGNGNVREVGKEDDDQRMEEELGDGFFVNGPTERAPVRYETKKKLHLLCQHQVHGHVTGLAALRTIESSVDGLDRLLVSFRDAKMALMEWSRGDLSTVSLHTYERCPQILNGDLKGYTPILRSDPLSRMAILTLPEDALAILPVLQEQSDIFPTYENFSREVPYLPSFVLSLPEISPALKNLQDLLFLPGFHSPTVALLYSPTYTWAGRYHSARDTFCLEIRTMDLSSGGTYPVLTSVKNLPADSLYLVSCPTGLGGIVLITTTGIIHIEQTGRMVCTSLNAWWSYTTNLKSDNTCEKRKLSLEGSKCVFVDEKDMLLILQDGDVHQVRFEMDGRAVGTIRVDEKSSEVPPPSAVVSAGDKSLFMGSAEGDSWLAKVNMVRETVEVPAKSEEKAYDMEVDYDDDLYGDSEAPAANGLVNGVKHEHTGPANIHLSPHDTLTGLGKILDIEFGIAATDVGARTYPQLVAISGGSKRSTFNVFRRGIPITKRRRFNELANADNVWFLPIQRQSGQRHRGVPEAERTTLLFSSEGSQTRIFALSTKANPEQIGRMSNITIEAAPFFQRSCVVHVSPVQVALLDSDGKQSQVICPSSKDSAHITSASISDPYIVIRRTDGTSTLFVGDTVARTVSEVDFTPGADRPSCQAIEVFTDSTGIYRTFEASSSSNGPSNSKDHKDPFAHQPRIPPNRSHTSSGPGGQGSSNNKIQLTSQQIKRLQDEKPAISVEAETAEAALHASKGSQWLAFLTSNGELQIRSLPDMTLVLQSEGVSASEPSFTDDLVDGTNTRTSDDEVLDEVKRMVFLPIGSGSARPHLMVLHQSGRLNVYEALPRFTLDASLQSRRSLAVRYRKVHTQLLPVTAQTKLPYRIHVFENLEGQSGAFITGDKPHWILSSDKHGVKSFGLKQAAMAFGRTTHLGGMGEYFVRIEDGSFICYLPPTLNTELSLPCDRYIMPRVYTNIVFDPPSAHYLGAASIKVPFQAYDEEGEVQSGPTGENLIPPTNERSSLELFSQGSDPWRIIDGYEFDQNEVVLCMQSVNLESSSTSSGYRDFIAVGTGFDFAEDRATRGNSYIFEVIETIGSPEKPGSNWKLKMRAKDPARNPVSAIGNMNGYLLNSNGPKMYLKGLDYDEKLMGLAFLDINLYATSITTFKNFMILSDFMRSIWFVAMQEDPYKLTVISKDLQEIETVSGDFLVHEGQVTFVTTDRLGEMRLYEFDPADPESFNGERLIKKTEFHLGTIITASKMIARRRSPEEEYAPQTQIIYATEDGALATAVSVKPARFKRLQLVSDQLVRNAQHLAGLNPRAFRTVKADGISKPLTKGVLDGDLLSHFALQPVKRQREMMRQIGTDAATVANDLQALSGFW